MRHFDVLVPAVSKLRISSQQISIFMPAMQEGVRPLCRLSEREQSDMDNNLSFKRSKCKHKHFRKKNIISRIRHSNMALAPTLSIH